MKKKISYAEAVTLLNGLVDGLGMMFGNNTKEYTNKLNRSYNQRSLSEWIFTGFVWADSDEGSMFWVNISNIIDEIEDGSGTYKNQKIGV